MKKRFLIPIALVIFLGSFVLYTFQSTGFFREINNTTGYEIIAELPLKGAEDLTISYEDGFMIISQDDRAGRRDGNPSQGHLYFLDLKTDSFDPIKLTHNLPLKFFPHGISMIKLDSFQFQILVVNHADGHTIEKFELFGPDSLVHVETYRDPSMVSPNDVVAKGPNSFYFTNDHAYTEGLGLLAENYLGLAVSNVIFYDGDYQEVAGGISYANGINISKDQSQVLVAAPRSFSLRYYDIEPNGDLILDHELDLASGIDNIELDQDGTLWIGSHPSLLAFTSYAQGKKPIAPSEVISVSGDQVTSHYVNDGSLVSASSVVAPYNDMLFVGTVMDDLLVVLKKKGE